MRQRNEHDGDDVFLSRVLPLTRTARTAPYGPGGFALFIATGAMARAAHPAAAASGALVRIAQHSTAIPAAT